MPPKSKKKTSEKKQFTDKQRLFIDAYVSLLNKTKAALQAGYSPDTAAEMGYENLKKPHIRAEVNRRLSELTLNKEETLKAISDIAEGDLSDYFIITERWHTPQVKKHLSEVIRDIENQIEDADKFILRAKIQDPKAIDAHNAEQDRRYKEIIHLQIELERNPEAFRFSNGEPYLVKVAELDMVKLVADKAAGRIKSYKMTEFGVNVELYPADAALRDLARVHGLYEKDNKQSATVINVVTED